MCSHLGQWQNATLVTYYKAWKSTWFVRCKILNIKINFIFSSLEGIKVFDILFSWTNQILSISHKRPPPPLCGWIKRPILFPRQHTEGRERRRTRRRTTRQSCSEWAQCFNATAVAMAGLAVQIYNAGGFSRVVSTKPMPGTQWIRALTDVGCRVEASGMQNIIIIIVVVVVCVFSTLFICQLLVCLLLQLMFYYRQYSLKFV